MLKFRHIRIVFELMRKHGYTKAKLNGKFCLRKRYSSGLFIIITPVPSKLRKRCLWNLEARMVDREVAYKASEINLCTSTAVRMYVDRFFWRTVNMPSNV